MTKVIIYGTPQRWMRPGQRRGRGGRVTRFTDPKAAAHKDMVSRKLAVAHKGPPWQGPVAMKFTAVFAIPESWPKYLKAAAMEGRVPHVADPDLDQLIKQVKDAASGIVFVDDNQVAMYLNPAKRYGHPERTEVEFIPINQDPDAITPGQRRVGKRQRDKALSVYATT